MVISTTNLLSKHKGLRPKILQAAPTEEGTERKPALERPQSTAVQPAAEFGPQASSYVLVFATSCGEGV